MRRMVEGPPVVAWVAARTQSHFGPAVGIGLDDGAGRIIAGVVFDGYNGVSIQMHCAADPGARWLTREFLWFVFHYPLEQLRVRTIVSPVAEGNAPARRFIKHIGFREGARIEDAHQSGAILLYVMRRGDCRWLQLRSGKHDDKNLRMAA